MFTRVIQIGLVLLLIFTAACSSTNSPSITPQPLTATQASLIPVKACYSAISATQTVVPYAYEKGIFKKYGLDVSLQFMSDGSTAVIALLSGDLEICQVAGAAVVNAQAASQDVVMIAGFFNTMPSSIFVRPEIKTVADLKGKALAVTGFGGSTEALTRIALKKYGIDPDKDITLLAMGEGSARLAALDANQIAGSLFTPPMSLQVRNKGYTELINITDLKIPYQNTGLAVTRTYLKDHQDVTTRFMKAVIEAMALIRKDPEGTGAVIAKYNNLDPVKDKDVVDESYREVILKALSDVPYPSTEGVKMLIDSAAATNAKAAKLTPEMVVDTAILKTLETNGFISSVQK